MLEISQGLARSTFHTRYKVGYLESLRLTQAMKERILETRNAQNWGRIAPSHSDMSERCRAWLEPTVTAADLRL
jgi:hypothetical protein